MEQNVEMESDSAKSEKEEISQFKDLVDESMDKDDNSYNEMMEQKKKKEKNPSNKAKKKFNEIIYNYKSTQENLNNIIMDIEKLDKIHNLFVSNAENKLRFHEYGIYVDDIYYQIKLLKIEYHCNNQIQFDNINKLYKDLYRLYNLLVKKLISMKFEINPYNSIVSLKVKMNQERKNYLVKIKPYNEIADNHIHLDECIVLYNEIEQRTTEFQTGIYEILKSIKNVDEQNSEGVLLHTYLISLKSEKEKAEIEISHYQKLLMGILNSHLEMSSKYLKRTKIISEEVTNHEVIRTQSKSDS